jgi:uncharacterized protein
MGRSPVPLSQFVLKVHSRCDLACDHCYVYEAADQSWRGRPMNLSDEVISRIGQRIAEHAGSHGLGTVQVILHGGEPLLAGPARLRRVAAGLRSALRGICGLDLRIQTNGVLLDEEFCELFAEHDVSVGISIDGDRQANDRHRRYADGRSSYDQALAAIGLLRTGRFRRLYGGLLCTVDVANNPLAVYDSLLQLDPPRIDFLLPHANWAAPPPGAAGASSPYADWLIAIFDRWLAAGRPVLIRMFESVISTLSGGDSLTEALGLAPSALVVIETDGTYEQVDSLKAAFDGAPATGLNVFTDSLDVVAEHPGIRARQQGLAGLCQTCRDCPVVTSCGGGLYPHRYRAATGFQNPSVYCGDLLKLISHISGCLPGPVTTGPRTPPHALSQGDFRQLAAGFGNAAAISQLADAQRSLRRVLAGAVYQAGSDAATVPDAAKARLQAAWTVLTDIDRLRPETLDTVLAHPYVRVWAVRCLQRLNQATDADGLATDLAHLGAIAAAAAIRAGAPADLTVPVIDAAVHLPTIGRLVISPVPPVAGAEPEAGSVISPVPPVAGAEPDAGSVISPVPPVAGAEPDAGSVVSDGTNVTFRVAEGHWRLSRADLLAGASRAFTAAQGARSAEWQPVRRLESGRTCVWLEDTDPYRDCHQWRAAPRLTDSEFYRWQRHFQAAWREIEREHPDYAPAITAGLTVLTPLAAAGQDRDISATARQAFGAVAAALPDDPVTLALLLIHEFQHVKLGAVLDLYDLYDATDHRLFHAPWRQDLRPLEGLLQGTYAHLAVTDFWRVRQRVSTGPAAETARERFAYWHAHTRAAIETLSGSGSLTPLGARFVDEMRQSAAR